jgi:hypothetical protein
MTTLIVLPSNSKPFTVPLSNEWSISDICRNMNVSHIQEDQSKGAYAAKSPSLNDLLKHRSIKMYGENNGGGQNCNLESVLYDSNGYNKIPINDPTMPPRVRMYFPPASPRVFGLVVPVELFAELGIHPSTLEYTEARELAAQEKAKKAALYYEEIKAEALKRLEAEKREADIKAMMETLRAK